MLDDLGHAGVGPHASNSRAISSRAFSVTRREAVSSLANTPSELSYSDAPRMSNAAWRVSGKRKSGIATTLRSHWKRNRVDQY
jgi:hypothetical protein